MSISLQNNCIVCSPDSRHRRITSGWVIDGAAERSGMSVDTRRFGLRVICVGTLTAARGVELFSGSFLWLAGELEKAGTSRHDQMPGHVLEKV